MADDLTTTNISPDPTAGVPSPPPPPQNNGLTPDQIADVQARYNEMQRRGLFTKNADAAAWGQEVVRRGLVQTSTGQRQTGAGGVGYRMRAPQATSSNAQSAFNTGTDAPDPNDPYAATLASKATYRLPVAKPAPSTSTGVSDYPTLIARDPLTTPLGAFVSGTTGIGASPAPSGPIAGSTADPNQVARLIAAARPPADPSTDTPRAAAARQRAQQQLSAIDLQQRFHNNTGPDMQAIRNSDPNAPVNEIQNAGGHLRGATDWRKAGEGLALQAATGLIPTGAGVAATSFMRSLLLRELAEGGLQGLEGAASAEAPTILSGLSSALGGEGKAALGAAAKGTAANLTKGALLHGLPAATGGIVTAGASEAQNGLLNLISPKTAQQMNDTITYTQKQLPVLSMGAQALGMAPFSGVGELNAASLPARLASGAMNTGLTYGMSNMQGQTPSVPDLISAFGTGALFGGETPLGEAVSEAGAKPVSSIAKAAAKTAAEQAADKAGNAVATRRNLPSLKPAARPVESTTPASEVSPYDMEAQANIPAPAPNVPENAPPVVQLDHGNQQPAPARELAPQNGSNTTERVHPVQIAAPDTRTGSIGQENSGSGNGVAQNSEQVSPGDTGRSTGDGTPQVGAGALPETTPNTRGLNGQTSTIGIKNAADLSGALQQHFGYDKPTADATAAIADARAQTHAAWTGQTPEKYYQSRFGGVTEGLANGKDVKPTDPQAKVDFLKSNQSILRAMNAPDASSGLHELAHVFRRDIYNNVGQNGFTPEDIAHVEGWAGVKEPGVWGRSQEEKFSRGFEKYLQDGDAPTSAVGKAFDYLKDAITRVYQSVRGTRQDPTNVPISPEVRDVFDRLLGKGVESENGNNGILRENSNPNQSDLSTRDGGVSSGNLSPSGLVPENVSGTGGVRAESTDDSTAGTPSATRSTSDRAGSIGTKTLAVDDATRAEIAKDAEAAGLGPKGVKLEDLKASGQSRPFGVESLKGVQPGTVAPEWTKGGGTIEEYGGRLKREMAAAKMAQKQAQAFHDLQNTPESKAARDKATADYGVWLKHASEWSNVLGVGLRDLGGQHEPLVGEAAGKSADDILLPKKGVKTPSPKSPEYGRGNKFSISSGEKAALIEKARAELLSLNQEGIKPPKAEADDANTLNQEATPLHDSLARAGSFHIEAGSKKYPQFKEALAADLGPEASKKLTEGDWQTIYANARDYVEDKVKAAGGVGGSRTTFVEQLTPVLGKTGTADFMNAVANLPNGPDIQDRFVTGGKDALTPEENRAVTGAYLDTISGIRSEQEKGAASRRTGAMADLMQNAAEFRKAQAAERLKAMRAAKAAQPKAPPAPPTPEESLATALAARYKSQKGAQAFLDTVGPDLAGRLSRGESPASGEESNILAAHQAAQAVQPGKPTRTPTPNEGVKIVSDIVAESKRAATLQRQAAAKAKIDAERAAKAAAPKPVPTKEEAYTKTLVGGYGTKGAEAFKSAIGDDTFQKLVDGAGLTDLTPQERQSVVAAHNANRRSAPSTTNPIRKGLTDILKEGQSAARAAKRAQDLAAQTPVDKFVKQVIQPKLGEAGAADFRKAVGEDVLDRVVNGGDVTAEERAKLGDEIVNRLPANAAKPTPAFATAQKTLSEAVRSTRQALEKQRQDSLWSSEVVRENLLKQAPMDEKTGELDPKYISKMNAALDQAGENPFRLAEVLGRFSKGNLKNALSYYSRGNLYASIFSNPKLLGAIFASHVGAIQADDISQAIGVAARNHYLGKDSGIMGYPSPADNLHAVGKAATQGVPDALHILAKGEPSLILKGRQDFPRPVFAHEEHGVHSEYTPIPVPNPTAQAIFNAYSRLPMREHGALYRVLNTGLNEKYSREIARSYANKEADTAHPDGTALSGAARSSFINARMRDHLANPTPEMVEYVSDRISHAMFTNRNTVAVGVPGGAREMIKTNADNLKANPAGLDLRPVISTVQHLVQKVGPVPANVMGRSYEYAAGPISALRAANVLKQAGKGNIKLDPQQADRVAMTLGRGAVGSALGAAAFGASILKGYQNGSLQLPLGVSITPAPDDEKEAKFHGTTVNYNDKPVFDTKKFGVPLAAGDVGLKAGQYVDQYRKNGLPDGKTMFAQAMRLAAMPGEENPLGSAVDTGYGLLSALKDPSSREGQKAIGQLLTSQIPYGSFWGHIAAAGDPTGMGRKKDSALDYGKMLIPADGGFGRYSLPVSNYPEERTSPEVQYILNLLENGPRK